MSTRQFRYSEIFFSFQGEGKYTGVPTAWYRSWGCNFNCNGFGQENPCDPSTWILDYLEIDPSNIKSLKCLPVFERGCDSSYSWSKKFAHLAHKGTAKEICTEIENVIKNSHNPEGKFKHPKSNQWIHMAFTGGEPMLAQTAIIEILDEFERRNNFPAFITIETNGTQFTRTAFREKIEELRGKGLLEELFWSASPKLYLSGEKWEDAIRPEVLADYYSVSKEGQLKYVVDGSQRAWDEVEEATRLYREAGIDWEVWIMPVGGTKEEQEEVQAEIAEEAIKRGYNVAARVHCWVFKNSIGK